MRTIIVDNEAFAVQNLTKILTDIGKTEIIATYTSSRITKDEIVAKQPDLVFANLKMPTLTGLELGSYLKKKLPHIKIILMMSYEQYTSQVDDLGVIDYILKPFEAKIIDTKLNELPQIKSNEKASRPMVCLFGELRFIYYEGNNDVEISEVIDGKWRTKLAREMFLYMMNSRGRYIRKDTLVELFWPDLAVKEGYNILYATIHYIRKFLKDICFPIIIENADEYYSLQLNGVLVDVDYAYEKYKKFKHPMNPKFQQITKLYQNHYLAEENYAWAEYNRQRYRIKWLESIRQTISTLENETEYTAAILYALKYQHLEPYMEESYFILMKLFAKTRDYKSVTNEYERLTEMMHEEYHESPNKEIVAWYKNWVGASS